MPHDAAPVVRPGLEPGGLMQDGLSATGSDPDTQRRYLLDAMRSVEDQAEGDLSEMAAKALHLVACAAAVDFMCREGQLPADWQSGTTAGPGAG